MWMLCVYGRSFSLYSVPCTCTRLCWGMYLFLWVFLTLTSLSKASPEWNHLATILSIQSLYKLVKLSERVIRSGLLYSVSYLRLTCTCMYPIDRHTPYVHVHVLGYTMYLIDTPHRHVQWLGGLVGGPYLKELSLCRACIIVLPSFEGRWKSIEWQVKKLILLINIV